MYYPGEAIWAGEGVVAIRDARFKLVEGTARDPHHYRGGGTAGTSGSGGSDDGSEDGGAAGGGTAAALLARFARRFLKATLREALFEWAGVALLASDDPTWTTVIFEAAVRLIEPLMGPPRFDTLRAVITWCVYCLRRFVCPAITKPPTNEAAPRGVAACDII